MERISKTRLDFLLNNPFLGELCLRLAIKENNAIPTMGVDGKYLYYNRKWVEGISDKHLKGVIAHEIGHIVAGHCFKSGTERGKKFPPHIWTMACEFWANHFVIDLCQLSLPDKAFYSKKYSDGSWDTVAIAHDLLLNQPVVQSVQIDDHSVWNDAQEDAELRWKIAIAQASSNSKRYGELPDGIERLVNEVISGKISWQTVLAEFLLTKGKEDYSYRRFNKRYLPQGVYLPSLYSDTVNIGFAIDTSGSMTEEDLSAGLAEIRGICSIFPSYRLHLFACDAKVHYYQLLTPSTSSGQVPYDDIDVRGLLTGGGGTSFVPVFEKIQEEEILIDALVYFTDAEGDFPKREPDYPVLWVVKGNTKVPWGRRIQYE